MTENTTLIIAIIGGILVLLFLVRYAVIGSKDKYDIEKLSKGELPAQDEKLHLNRLSARMGAKNFKDICGEAEEMVRLGKKDEAANYLIQLAGLKKEKAENLVNIFEQRHRK